MILFPDRAFQSAMGVWGVAPGTLRAAQKLPDPQTLAPLGAVPGAIWGTETLLSFFDNLTAP